MGLRCDSLVGRPRSGQNTLSFGTALHLGRACTILCSVSTSGSLELGACRAVLPPQQLLTNLSKHQAVSPTQTPSWHNDRWTRNRWKHGNQKCGNLACVSVRSARSTAATGLMAPLPQYTARARTRHLRTCKKAWLCDFCHAQGTQFAPGTPCAGCSRVLARRSTQPRNKKKGSGAWQARPWQAQLRELQSRSRDPGQVSQLPSDRIAELYEAATA